MYEKRLGKCNAIIEFLNIRFLNEVEEVKAELGSFQFISNQKVKKI